MSKKQKTQTAGRGEQLTLIDVLPKKAKPIIAAARILKRLQVARSSAQDKENDQKAKFLNLIAEAEIPRLADGKIKFHHDGVTVKVTPKQESVSITEED